MERKLNILHLEDNATDAELIASWLEEGGLDCEIVRVDTRDDFVTVLRELSFDLIFADRTTPTFDGLSALALARELQPATPFIFISGTLDEELAITTLRNGATDYVLKHRLSRLLPAVERAITELQQRKELDRAAQGLKEQAELLDRANDMIMIRDLKGRITYWNSGAERLYGWTKSEANGQVLHELLQTNFFKPQEDLQAQLLQTEHWEGELEHQKKDGSRVLVESRWTLRRDSQGTATSILEINTDLTERRRLQEQLVQAQKLESLGTLAGGIAHDFNNILSIVLGYASLLETVEPRSTEIEEISATMIQAGERGASLVRQLLTFARKNPTVFAPMIVNDLVEDVLKMLKQTFPKTITFSKELDPQLKPIVADGSQIHQVLLNLCVNARDAMPDGGTLQISTAMVNGATLQSRFPAAGDGDYVHLEVHDSGTGMSTETRQRLFEPFFTTKEVGKGTGLGLAVVYGAVQSHRGFIQLDSELGQGTTFSLYFPAEEKAAVASVMSGFAISPRGNNELILVVEDERMLRDLLEGMLIGNGYRVLLARDGIEGLTIFQREKHCIDLVLSDMGMPKLGGLEMYIRMKESGITPRLLLCSGFLEPTVKLQLVQAGVRDFLLKPARPAQILRKIHEILHSTGERDSEPSFL
ncbi:MAG TPA: response regulator [Chthoniobacteraceae bacterium]|jgi:PAS domain S-box-containing protein